MKKFLVFISLFALWTASSIASATFAEAESNPIYAKIEYTNAYFYSLPEDKESNKLFMLPYSYFVKLLANEGDNFYYAQYHEIFGYVKKAAVTPMQGIPQKPFATTTFRVFALQGLGLYNKPDMNEEKLADIPYLSDSLIFYGTLQGQEVIPDKSNQWYFAKCSQTSNFGYVYSVFCDQLNEIEENKETFPLITTPLFTPVPSSDEISPVAMTFIIIGVSLPCLIVFYLLVKPTMIKEKLTKAAPKLKARRNHDYFEFDEGDLN